MPLSDRSGAGAPEGPLAYLPCSTVLEYRKAEIIYEQGQPSACIYLVLNGKVKLSRLADTGQRVLVDIYQVDEFFGESAFLNLPARCEQASALENTTLMTWTTSVVEEIIMNRPSLAVSFLQIAVQRTMDYAHRIESFSVDTIAHRLARALMDLAERLGNREEDGSIRLLPLTHELLSQYIGTSRELITSYMNQFRRDGYLKYSRSGIVLRPDHLGEWLRTPPRTVRATSPPLPGELAQLPSFAR